MHLHRPVALLSSCTVSLGDMVINLSQLLNFDRRHLWIMASHVPPWVPESFVLCDSKRLTMTTFLTWLCAEEQQRGYIITYGKTPFAKWIKGVGSCARVQQKWRFLVQSLVLSKSINDVSTEEIFHSYLRPSATRRCLLLGSIRDTCIYPLPKGYWFISSYSWHVLTLAAA